MRFNRLHLLGILMLAVFTFACSKDKGNPPSTPIRDTIFVHGDPNEIIRGATTTTRSPLTTRNFEEWNEYSLVTFQSFVERQKARPVLKTQDEVEKANDNSAVITDQDPQLYAIQFDKVDQYWDMHLFGGGAALLFSETENGELQPRWFIYSEEPIEVTPIHWSVSKNGDYVSLLVGVETSLNGRQLLTFYFEKKAPQKEIPKTSSEYIYLFGAGEKIGWNIPAGTDLDLQFCGDDPAASTVPEAVRKWNDVLSNRLHIQFSSTKSYAPFSDLNQHCIYVINSYLYKEKETIGSGMTQTIISRSRVEIIDSDIFLFRSELQKAADSLADSGFSVDIIDKFIREEFVPHTITHEIGHFLGLGHKFHGPPSIMSYEMTSTGPERYDIRALHELYPVVSSAGTPDSNSFHWLDKLLHGK